MKKPNLKTYRRSLQVGVALAFVVIPYLNTIGINLFYGNFLSFYAAGLPLADPLAVLQVAIKSWPIPTKFLIGGCIALVLAFFLGTSFCAWICPFGLLSELVHHMSKLVMPSEYKGLHFRITGFPVKCYILGLSLFGFILLASSPFLNEFSMPGWYSRIFQFLFGQNYLSLATAALLAIFLVEFVTQNRLWCRYICPQALLLVFAQLPNPYRLRVCYSAGMCACKADPEPCIGSCSLSLNPKALVRSLETECTNCGDCVVVCKRVGNALGFQLESCKESIAKSQ
jgi:ferredoxin-type protein NapH